MTRDRFSEMISGYLDGELDAGQRAAFETELARSESLQRELDAIRSTKEVTDSMRLVEFPDRAWEAYWRRTYNRMERQIGWIVLSIGAMILVGFGSYEFATSLLTDESSPLWVRLAVGLSSVGLAILFVSVLRERITLRRVDPYREVDR